MRFIFLTNSYPGVFGIEHILYMVICLILMITGLILIKKYVKKEDVLEKIINIVGIILLITILANRISVTYYDVVVNQREGYTWWNLLPNSFCGLSSLVLSLTIIFGKKNNLIFHCICYIGFLGGFLTFIYPDFLDSQSFFDIRTITGLLHHTIMLWLVILMVMTKYFIPDIKKWYIYPLGMTIIMTFGIFEKDALGFSKAFQISEALLKSLPILTSWYVVGIISIILQIVFLKIYTHFENNSNTK